MRSHLSTRTLTALAATGGRQPGQSRCPPPSPALRSRLTGSSPRAAKVHLASRYVIGLVIFVDIPGARTAGIVADADLLLALL